MAQMPVDSMVNDAPFADATPGADADRVRYPLPSHALPFSEPECDDSSEHGMVALLAELRHWWWAGLISDGEYRAKEEEILQLGRA